MKKLSHYHLIFAFIALAFLLMPQKAAAQASFPIQELGNCGSMRACFLYCQQLENTPACWSYGKYVLKKAVLGEATESAQQSVKPKISFPVAELGNCTNAAACKAFCSDPANHDACTAFGKRMGLLKEKPPKTNNGNENLLKTAKTLLGCNSMESCRQVCSDPANRQKCEDVIANMKRPMPNATEKVMPPGFVQNIQKELGCDTAASCKDVCTKPENKEKCKDVLQKITPENIMKVIPSGLPCDSAESCKMLKEKVTKPLPSNFMKQGCMTEGECKALCESNPDKCPGFLKNKNLPGKGPEAKDVLRLMKPQGKEMPQKNPEQSSKETPTQ